MLASQISKVAFTVSLEKDCDIQEFLENSKELFTSSDRLVIEDEETFIKTIKNFNRIIYSTTSKVSAKVFKESSSTLVFIVRQEPMMEGRLELLNYLGEQSISHSYHRYGNIGSRGME